MRDRLPAACDGSALEERRRHWILSEPPLRSWIAALARDYRRLQAWGAGPFAGQRIAGFGVIEQLGFAQRPAPTGVLDHLWFTTAMFIAAWRACLAIHRELAALSNAAGT